jgi:hypothetical protein
MQSPNVMYMRDWIDDPEIDSVKAAKIAIDRKHLQIFERQQDEFRRQMEEEMMRRAGDDEEVL